MPLPNYFLPVTLAYPYCCMRYSRFHMIYNQINEDYGYLKMSLSGLSARKDKTFYWLSEQSATTVSTNSQFTKLLKQIIFEVQQPVFVHCLLYNDKPRLINLKGRFLISDIN